MVIEAPALRWSITIPPLIILFRNTCELGDDIPPFESTIESTFNVPYGIFYFVLYNIKYLAFEDTVTAWPVFIVIGPTEKAPVFGETVTFPVTNVLFVTIELLEFVEYVVDGKEIAVFVIEDIRPFADNVMAGTYVALP